MRWIVRVGLVLAAFVLVIGVFSALGGVARFGRFLGRGAGSGQAVPASRVVELAARQTRAARGVAVGRPRQILFGDLHVHTSFSVDAFIWGLPALQGNGIHPPADACDFARFCSGLDFWSINDHAEDLTPARWRETVEAVRECNAVAGVSENPDLVTLLGWEWTQIGETPEEHYGHRNVILRSDAQGEVPTHPIAARRELRAQTAGSLTPAAALGVSILSWIAPGDRQTYYDFARYLEERGQITPCPAGLDARELPEACQDLAATPAELFARLDQWGFDALVIPHGLSWGYYTPAGATLDKQLAPGMHDPERQRLIEVFSGHGSSEEYRAWRGVEIAADGTRRCPAASPDYLPSCWRAGEIVAGRCLAAGESAEECARWAAEARQRYVDAGQAGHRTVPGSWPEEWLDSGQCRDCFLPAFNYRPAESTQYGLALRNFELPGGADRFRFGFIASSDNHGARPGTGYKEIGRLANSEAGGGTSELAARLARGPRGDVSARSADFDPTGRTPFAVWETERQASFFTTGGLVAAHADGRSRDALWRALARREVYGTSGDRILLWFDLLNAPGAAPERPMGSEVAFADTPRFRVRAVGAHRQLPGCPDESVASIGAARLANLCGGECYHPSEERKLITRIEIVRIRPRGAPDEPIAPLIEDPWLRFDCPRDPAGCIVEFEDPRFAIGGRDSVYYVRAIEEASPVVNGDGLRCTGNAESRVCEPCWGDHRGDADDECLALVEERAWSSPIFLDYAPPSD